MRPVSAEETESLTQHREHTQGPTDSEGDAAAARIEETSGGTSLGGCGVEEPVGRAEMGGVVLQLWRVAIPAAFGSLFWNTTQWIALSFVGQRLGATALEGLATGVMVYNVCSISLCIGMISGLDTLASQAFGRDPRNPELGQLLQTTVVVISLLASPCYVFFYFCEPLLYKVFEPALAAGAAEFLHSAYVYLAVMIVNFAMYSTLNAGGLTHLPLLGAVCSAAVVLVLSYFYLYSIAATVWILTSGVAAYNLMLIGCVLYHPKLEGVRRARWPLDPVALRRDNVVEFLKQGLPAMVAVCSEWWGFEVLLLISASLGATAVGVMTLAFNTLQLCFLIPSGLSKGATATVGNALGANKPRLAKLSALASIGTVCAAQLAMMVVVLLFGRRIWRVWTHDEALLDAASGDLIFLAIAPLFDGTQYVFQGIFRAAGEQEHLAKRVLFSIWGVGVTSAYLLSHYTSLGPRGVVFGMTLGLVVEVPLLVQRFVSWDWRALAVRAAQEQATDSKRKEDPTPAGDDTELEEAAAIRIVPPAAVHHRSHLHSTSPPTHVIASGSVRPRGPHQPLGRSPIALSPSLESQRGGMFPPVVLSADAMERSHSSDLHVAPA